MCKSWGSICTLFGHDYESGWDNLLLQNKIETKYEANALAKMEYFLMKQHAH